MFSMYHSVPIMFTGGIVHDQMRTDLLIDVDQFFVWTERKERRGWVSAAWITTISRGTSPERINLFDIDLSETLKCSNGVVTCDSVAFYGVEQTNAVSVGFYRIWKWKCGRSGRAPCRWIVNAIMAHGGYVFVESNEAHQFFNCTI